MAKYIFYATKFYEDANSTLKVLSMHNLTTYLNFYFLKALVTNRPCFLAIKFFFFGREGGGVPHRTMRSSDGSNHRAE